MSKFSQYLLHAAVGSTLLVSAGFAQNSSQNTQPQAAQDQYSGVSHPPNDDTITASPDMSSPAPKPSAAVPAVPPPPPAQPVASVPAAAPVNPANDPNYGIVSSVPAHPDEDADASGGATLSRRSMRADSDDDIVHIIPSSGNELAEGTNIRVRLSQGLSTTSTSSGQSFKGVVAYNVYKNGRVIIPAGSELRGRVVGVTQGHHIGSHATLRLRPDMVLLPDGTAYHLYAQVVQSQAPGTRTDDEGGIQPSSNLKKDSIEYGAGAGTGALVGAKIAGPQGALVGGLVGAGVVTAHLLMQHPRAATVPEGSEIVFSLTEPMALTPTRN
ncbi:hypothetical protein [Paracidobacterium acidisoli]|uniref:TrbI/VirB10 family protein n=1 Tax=Paracidobacterium acidisoli TaxID=2303751 RepID=A0A372IS65_9BACT|nr:hypothetical protein [Paracidobacterium acidisoli]MBT9330687.1 hypothetical protein [Paracidobacterium acidisoli]